MVEEVYLRRTLETHCLILQMKGLRPRAEMELHFLLPSPAHQVMAKSEL